MRVPAVACPRRFDKRRGPVFWLTARARLTVAGQRRTHTGFPGHHVVTGRVYAYSVPASSVRSSSLSGAAARSERKRSMRSAMGGCVENSPEARASNFLIGFTM